MPSPYPEVPDEAESDAVPLAPGEKVMGFLDHLEELRWTLVKCVGTFGFFAILIGAFLIQFKGVVERPWNAVVVEFPEVPQKLIVFEMMEVYVIMLQLCLIGALAVSLPFILFFIGQFISPALTSREKGIVLPVASAAMGLFLSGVSFAYFVLAPAAVRVAIQATLWMGFEMRETAGDYYSLMTWLLVGIGSVFEFPLLILLVTYLGIVDLATLRRSRRLVFMICMIVAAIATPTTDMFTMMLVTVPLYFLFELSLIAAAIVLRRKARAALAAEHSLEG